MILVLLGIAFVIIGGIFVATSGPAGRWNARTNRRWQQRLGIQPSNKGSIQYSRQSSFAGLAFLAAGVACLIVGLITR